jgi:hypothetical protein
LPKSFFMVSQRLSHIHCFGSSSLIELLLRQRVDIALQRNPLSVVDRSEHCLTGDLVLNTMLKLHELSLH